MGGRLIDSAMSSVKKRLKESPLPARSNAMVLSINFMKEIAGFIPTRRSLLSRLKDWDDHESWRVFFDTYWKLIYSAAMKAGLTDAEAQDVVQETVISVMKSMPGFKYDVKVGSFKGWLLRLTRWRVVDQFRKRQRGIDAQKTDLETSTGTSAIEAMIDPAGSKLEAVWDEEWESNLIDAALERVKTKVDSKQYQIFDLHVLKKWPVLKVAKMLSVNPGRVYLSKHRIGKLLKEEVNRLRTKLV
jgi:RNA polymerase sigma factor (sigma-70 family)